MASQVSVLQSEATPKRPAFLSESSLQQSTFPHAAPQTQVGKHLRQAMQIRERDMIKSNKMHDVQGLSDLLVEISVASKVGAPPS